MEKDTLNWSTLISLLTLQMENVREYMLDGKAKLSEILQYLKKWQESSRETVMLLDYEMTKINQLPAGVTFTDLLKVRDFIRDWAFTLQKAIDSIEALIKAFDELAYLINKRPWA